MRPTRSMAVLVTVVMVFARAPRALATTPAVFAELSPPLPPPVFPEGVEVLLEPRDEALFFGDAAGVTVHIVDRTGVDRDLPDPFCHRAVTGHLTSMTPRFREEERRFGWRGYAPRSHQDTTSDRVLCPHYDEELRGPVQFELKFVPCVDPNEVKFPHAWTEEAMKSHRRRLPGGSRWSQLFEYQLTMEHPDHKTPILKRDYIFMFRGQRCYPEVELTFTVHPHEPLTWRLLALPVTGSPSRKHLAWTVKHPVTQRHYLYYKRLEEPDLEPADVGPRLARLTNHEQFGCAHRIMVSTTEIEIAPFEFAPDGSILLNGVRVDPDRPCEIRTPKATPLYSDVKFDFSRPGSRR